MNPMFLENIVAQASSRKPDLSEEVKILLQGSVEQMNQSLSRRALRLRQAYPRRTSIITEELYVVSVDRSEDCFECSYLYGETYYSPPIIIPTEKQLKEMWEYLRRFPVDYTWYEFEEFMESKVSEALFALSSYGEMLSHEIVPLEYVLASPQGVGVYKALLERASHSHNSLIENGKHLSRSDAPFFMCEANDKKKLLARKILKLLTEQRPRDC